MKTYTYTLRPVCDLNDMVLFYEFVRNEDEVILRASKDYYYLFAYAEGYCSAMNVPFVIE